MKTPFLCMAALSAAAALLLAAAARGGEEHAPEFEFRSKVRAREMRFEQVTSVRVEFRGTPGRTTVDRSIRKNLPNPVQPGETYRDVEVETEISSAFGSFSAGRK